MGSYIFPDRFPSLVSFSHLSDKGQSNNSHIAMTLHAYCCMHMHNQSGSRSFSNADRGSGFDL